MMRQENPLSGRRTVIVCMMLLIAALHLFRVGSYLEGGLFNFYYSYFSDFALPFGGYFLLFMAESQVPVLKFWQSKMAVAFLVPSVAETCQFFGLPVLGSTFDWFDYATYAAGTISAVLVDRQVFSRLFKFWAMENIESG
jgi:hypothetical protein